LGGDEIRSGCIELGDAEVGEENLRFSTTISIVVLVSVSSFEILGILLLDLGISHVVTDAGIKFIEGLPLKLVPFRGKMASRSNGTLKGRGPDSEWVIFALERIRSWNSTRQSGSLHRMIA